MNHYRDPGREDQEAGSRVYPTRRGARIVQHGTVLSEVLSRPGPTHSVADVLAAAVNLGRAHGTVALLGFAGGGMVAPLRALGGKQIIEAVDLCDRHFQLFHQLCRNWCGPVRFHHEDALAWLRRQSVDYDWIIEDLSVAENGDVVKPEVSWGELPSAIRRRAGRAGGVVFNLLRPSGLSWASLSRLLPGRKAGRLWVLFEDFENRLLIDAPGLPSARAHGRALRQALDRLGSKLSGRIQVRTVPAED